MPRMNTELSAPGKRSSCDELRILARKALDSLWARRTPYNKRGFEAKFLSRASFDVGRSGCPEGILPPPSLSLSLKKDTERSRAPGERLVGIFGLLAPRPCWSRLVVLVCYLGWAGQAWLCWFVCRVYICSAGLPWAVYCVGFHGRLWAAVA